MLNVDSKLLEALKGSSCFGIAYDEEVPECKQCDVKGQCKAKSEGANIAIPTTKAKAEVPKSDTPETKKETKAKATSSKPATKAATKPSSPPKEAKKTSSGVPSNAPDFKPMKLEELKILAEERKVEWKDYGNDNITRMRLIMVLKKSYE